jgi:hypothetical protein
MKRSPVILAFLALILSGMYFDNLEGTCGAQISKESFLIDPAKSVGRIVPNCTEADLIRIYGAKNVQRDDIDEGEGDTVPGTILFPDSLDAVTIEWKHEYSQPQRITISSKGTHWQTKDGITIGTSLDSLEVINGCPFKLTGFAWDSEGCTVSWENGKLSRQLQLELTPTKQISKSEFDEVVGDRDFSSSFPIMKKMGLIVEKIFVRWD